jgi:hypothetical protein
MNIEVEIIYVDFLNKITLPRIIVKITKEKNRLYDSFFS